LGLWAFSIEAFEISEDDPQYVFELETDVRGTCYFRGHRLEITLGEIKGGKDEGSATEQLLKPLTVIGCAVRVLLPAELQRTPNPMVPVSLHGEIFSNSPWSVKPEEVEKERKSLNLKPFDALSISCVTV
jgi:hypothetical protein